MWISVKDQLPEEQQFVLVFHNFRHRIARYDSKMFRSTTGIWGLPKPPEND